VEAAALADSVVVADSPAVVAGPAGDDLATTANAHFYM
jgi:hypothetical protein